MPPLSSTIGLRAHLLPKDEAGTGAASSRSAVSISEVASAQEGTAGSGRHPSRCDAVSSKRKMGNFNWILRVLHTTADIRFFNASFRC